MTIDWITVSAQIVNFLILVWLLKRFLYRPVLDAMEARQQRIAARLNDAQARERAAEAAAAQYEEARQRLEAERDRELDRARAQADEQRKRLLAAARLEADEVRARWQQQIAAEQTEFLDRLRREAAAAIEAAVRRTLADLADARLEEQVARVFAERLQNADAGTRRALAETSGPVEVVTAFEADHELRTRLAAAIHEAAGAEPEVRYRRSPAVLCGVQLLLDGQRLDWNASRYLDELGKRVQESFERGRIAAEQPTEDA
jgi:F-type H+-transporting ATPase subunit b